MALSIKTEEADRLARELAGLTGETMTMAVTKALREELKRTKAALATEEDLPAKMREFAARLRPKLTRTDPVTKAEWDRVWGEED